MHISRFLRKVLAISLATFILILMIGCASSTTQPSPQVAPSLVIASTVFDTKAKDIPVYGSGFPANTSMDIVLSGIYTIKGTSLEVTDPGVILVKTDEQGAFKGRLRANKCIPGYGLSPGVYVLKAVEDQKVFATAPFELTKAKE